MRRQKGWRWEKGTHRLEGGRRSGRYAAAHGARMRQHAAQRSAARSEVVAGVFAVTRERLAPAALRAASELQRSATNVRRTFPLNQRS